MLKKTITYSDLDGNPITEDFYFNLNKAEIAEMELGHEGGFSTYLQRIIETDDGGEIMSTFKNIIMASIGRRSEDGRRFIKSEEITQDFIQSDAYSELFMDLVTDENKAIEFIQGIVPKDLNESVKKIENVSLPEKGEDEELPLYIRENRDPTKEEFSKMTQDEMKQAFEWKNRQKMVDNVKSQAIEKSE